MTKKKLKKPKSFRPGYVEYSSNNSGGGWWMSDEDWYALEKAGWEVRWCKDETGFSAPDKDGRWMGALATYAKRYGLNLREAADEFDRVTSCNSTDAGCPCCGNPHNFTEYDGADNWIDSGPHISHDCEW